MFGTCTHAHLRLYLCEQYTANFIDACACMCMAYIGDVTQLWNSSSYETLNATLTLGEFD